MDGPEDITLWKISETEKDKCHMISAINGILKKKLICGYQRRVGGIGGRWSNGTNFQL